GWLRRLLPLRRRNAGIAGRLRGRPSFASSSAIRATSDAFCATSASIRATSAAIKASFSGKSGGGVTRRLTHIPDVAATKKIQSQTPAHLHTLKGGVTIAIHGNMHMEPCPNLYCFTGLRNSHAMYAILL